MTGRGPIIIDWMTVTVRHPLADMACTVVLVRSGPAAVSGPVHWLFDVMSGQFEAAYLKRYFERRSDDRSLLAAWLPVIAAARMDEKIEGERERLIEMVKKG